jgi:hypothetical protein
MARSHKIDVVGPSFLEIQKNAGKPCKSDLPAMIQLTDRKVLAKVTRQVAGCHKNGTGSPETGDAGLFPKMKI